MTHEDLRKRAVQWLTNTKHCGVVLSEIVTYAGEVPDAIGWQHHASYLVECKISRSDWQRNGDKSHERSQRGAGEFRYILCPTGLIRPEEMEDDWGLLWWQAEGGSVRVKKEATRRERCSAAEITMLVSALRRIRAREFLVIVADGSAIPVPDERGGFA